MLTYLLTTAPLAQARPGLPYIGYADACLYYHHPAVTNDTRYRRGYFVPGVIYNINSDRWRELFMDTGDRIILPVVCEYDGNTNNNEFIHGNRHRCEWLQEYRHRKCAR